MTTGDNIPARKLPETPDEENGSVILIIDDEPVARASMEALLAQDGYRLVMAENGLKGLELLEEELIDIVLLDVMMPDLDGFEVCRRIRSTPRLKEMPILMVTALDDRSSRLQGLKAGADDFVSKPFDGAELRARVRTITRLNRYRRLVEQSERLAYLEDFDTLTDLPNRRLLESRLTQALLRARRLQEGVAVILIDLDGLDRMTDALGQQTSDEVIRETAVRLLRCVRGRDTVARIANNRFVILSDAIKPMQDISQIALRVHSALDQPITAAGRELVIIGNLGISLYPADGDRPGTLIQHAHTAMTRAKRLGNNLYQFFSPEMNAAAVERLDLEVDLRRALDRDELVLQYQPKIISSGHRLGGLEALVRWYHPKRGMVSPGKFIPLAEETGLIGPIGEWVMQKACLQVMSWINEGHTPVPVAVNLSSRQFRSRFEEIPGMVSRILAKTGLPPYLLELELTESLLMPDEKSGLGDTLKALTALKALGIRISIDDFGTGYSSLNYLHRFPVDALKVDRSFIVDILSSNDDAAITTSIIELAHNLGLKVIAEGVETAEQLEFLNRRGCDEIQGYLFSPPAQPDDIARILRGEIAHILPPLTDAQAL